jgi:uncharacterized protein YndB with AHSA1/START domain
MSQTAMNRTITIAPVRKSVIVEASPGRAFEIFTRGIDRWWPKDHGIGATPLTESVIEPRVGGRWYTKHADGSEVTVGHVRACELGQRIVFGWEVSAKWKPDPRVAFASEVEVLFTALGDGRTRVDLEHRDFEKMGAEDGATMRKGVDGGWPGLLERFAKAAAQGEPA